ncbi:MAG: glycosyl hydrolase, partial [Candidatus Eremiobacteraeota bacterium]|nr:glycosyl hydrolase [Candidatus Eremiobacteraeota bacterium]
IFSPHDPKVLYAGGNHVFRTTNGGQNWEVISPDLTRHDPRTLGPAGGPITKDQTGVETYATIFTIAESPRVRGVIWTGSDDGFVSLTRDGGRTWTNVTPPGMGDLPRISLIEASPHDPAVAYVAANRYQFGDLRPMLYKTANYGRTWTSIANGIPAEEFTRAIREDPVRRGLLYAATERGVWVSFDDGGRWQSLKRNLPAVPVHDVVIKDGDLIAATHGRSFYVMDDLSALRQMTPQTAAAPAHLFAPREAYRVSWGGGFGEGRRQAGKNPPSGASVYYTLSKPNQEVMLDFLDARGNVIRHFTSRLDSLGVVDSLQADSVKKADADSIAKAGGLPKTPNPQLGSAALKSESGIGSPGGEPEVDFEELMRNGPRPPRVPNKVGLNTFAWNLREPDAVRFTNMILWAGSTSGAMVPPGTYRVRMTVAGLPPQTQAFTVRADPRSRATLADIDATVALQRRVLDRLSAANRAVRTVRNIRAQLAERTAQVPAAQRAAFEAQTQPLLTTLAGAEEEIYQVRNQSSQDPLNYPIRINNKLAALAGVVASADPRPTQQSYVVFDSLSRQLQTQLEALGRATGAQLAAVNAELQRVGLKPVVPSDAEVRGKGEAQATAVEEDDAAGEGRRW